MNKDQSKLTLNVAQHIAPVIGSRDVINVLRDATNKADQPSVVLDFANVEFISRSAAHALLKLQEESEKQVEFANTNEAVHNMLRIVAESKNRPRQEVIFHPRRVEFNDLLSQGVV